MKLAHYPFESSESFMSFDFVSVGPKGSIQKVVKFQRTDFENLYNLAFGDKDAITGALDDLNVTNNGDTEKVLATVVEALYYFFNYYPNALVYATGSSPSRTRLYQIGISKYFSKWSSDLSIFGETTDNWEPFKPNKTYAGFLVMRNL